MLISIVGLLVLFYIKAGLQLQYKNLEDQKELGEINSFFVFDWKNSSERSRRIDAFLLFPLFFPIDLHEKKGQDLAIREKLKKVHLSLYAVFIVLIFSASYASKVFPEGIFS
jgi:hypothetical protein